MPKQVSLSDIAHLSGVSVSTVSRVLNDRGGASAETAARIHEIAERLEFYPNAMGRSLVTGRSGTIGVLAMMAPEVFHARVLVGVTVAIARQHLATYLHDLGSGHGLLNSHVQMLQAGRVDGVIVVGQAGSVIGSVTDRFRVPVVYVYSPSSDDRDTVFLPDERMAGRKAVEHLLSIGRRRIAHVTGSDLGARARSEGMRAALREADVPLAGGRPWFGDWTRRSGYELTQQVLENVPDLDAMFCGNDMIASGAHLALARAGRRVPEDVALVGYDNTEAQGGRQENGFYTSVDPCLGALGAAAAQHLTAAIGGETLVPGTQYVPSELVVRASTTGLDEDALPPMTPL